MLSPVISINVFYTEVISAQICCSKTQSNPINLCELVVNEICQQQYHCT